MDNNGWTDIFYNWLVHPDGTIVEGRGWGTSPRPENVMTVNFIGNYETDVLTEAAKASAGLMVRECVRRMPQLAGRDVKWHNQRAATACPGRNIISFIRERNALGWDAAPAAPTPPPTPTVVVQPQHAQSSVDRAALDSLRAEATELWQSAKDLGEAADGLADLSESNLELVREFRRDHL